MSERYDWAAAAPEERDAALEAAATALRRGDLVVLPTDTVYGIAADAFEAAAVASLLAAKGRGRQMPPPVLVGSVGMLDGIATSVPESGRALISAFWPGPLTIICVEQPSLVWDLGENEGTVAVRMPDHELALELLGRTGPLAVSSANLSGQPAATTADDAESQLGASVAVYLDDGPTPGPLPSSIVDLTGPEPVLLREGALTYDQLREVVPTLVELSDEVDEAEEEADTAADVGAVVAAGGASNGAAGDATASDDVSGGDATTSDAAAINDDASDSVESEPGAVDVTPGDAASDATAADTSDTSASDTSEAEGGPEVEAKPIAEAAEGPLLEADAEKGTGER